MRITYATASSLRNRPRGWRNMVSYTQPPPGAWDYTLNPTNKTTVTGSPTTWIFEKSLGSNWDSAVYGSVGYNTGTIIWKNPGTGAGSVVGGIVCGLSSTPSASFSFSNATYGCSVQSATSCEIYNGGSGSGAFSQTVNSTTEFKWVWTATQVQFFINNVQRGTNYAKTSGVLLYPFCSFNLVGATAQVASFTGA